MPLSSNLISSNLTDAPADQPDRTTPQEAVGARILLVDDDDIFRYATAQILRSAGYTVTPTEDYREALAVLEGQAELDLMITDVVMPNRVNGFALLRMARMRRQGLKVIYVTGFEKLPLNEADGPILRKPINQDALLATVRARLVSP